MSEQESSAAESPPKRLHPLPVFCWAWPVGGLFVMMVGAFILNFWVERPPQAVAEFPADHPRWRELLVIGCAGIVIGLAFAWFWHCFAVGQLLTRRMWHIGTGLILTGAAYLFMTGFPVPAFVFLLALAVWAHKFTRKHFDWS